MNWGIKVLQTCALPLGHGALLNWSGLWVSEVKTVDKRFHNAKSSECEKFEPSLRRRKISTHEKTVLEPIAVRLLAGFDALVIQKNV